MTEDGYTMSGLSLPDLVFASASAALVIIDPVRRQWADIAVLFRGYGAWQLIRRSECMRAEELTRAESE